MVIFHCRHKGFQIEQHRKAPRFRSFSFYFDIGLHDITGVFKLSHPFRQF